MKESTISSSLGFAVLLRSHVICGVVNENDRCFASLYIIVYALPPSDHKGCKLLYLKGQWFLCLDDFTNICKSPVQESLCKPTPEVKYFLVNCTMKRLNLLGFGT